MTGTKSAGSSTGPKHARATRCSFDLASLTLANEAHLDDLLTGYGNSVDVDMIRAWWSWRCLVVIRWLSENGYGDPQAFPEVAVLRSHA